MNKEEFVNCVQMADLDMQRFKGKTFYCIIAPTCAHSCCETTFLGDFATHTHIDEFGKVVHRQGKIFFSVPTSDEERSVQVEYG